jgi:hypothetical protein
MNLASFSIDLKMLYKITATINLMIDQKKSGDPEHLNNFTHENNEIVPSKEQP